jgi:hypothetical protein
MPPAPIPAPAIDSRVVAGWRRALNAAGFVLSVLLVARSQVAGDQLNLLARGWLLVAHGQFVPFGNPLSTGGKAPGGATTLLVALPLYLWRDHRAATLGIFLAHLLAYWLLDRTLRRILRPHERLLLAAVYWLNPWRLYFSAFLWNPNYLFLAGAAHLATALALRHRPSFWPSCLHGITLLIALQLHPAALLLVVASALLAWRRTVHFHWGGLLLGAFLGNLTLLPWYREVLLHPSLLSEAHRGFLGRGLVLLFPVLRGLLYWLRYASLSLAGRMTSFDFSEAFGAAARPLGGLLWLVTQVLAWPTVLLAALANFALLRRRRRFAPVGAEAPDRLWLRSYLTWTLAALVLVLAVAPTTFMYWQGFVLIPAAVLPLVLWSGALWRSRWRRWVPIGLALWVGLAALEGLGIAFGSPDYRCHGEDTVVFPLRSHSPMLDDLHIQSTCAWPLDQPGGWWPDVLPEAPVGRSAATWH